MKEMKFRAWNGCAMEYGGFSVHATGKIEATELTNVTEESPLMQYTGRKIKNDEELWESDIVEDNVGRRWVVEYNERNMMFLFSWVKDRTQKQPYRRFNTAQRPLRHIGDIYENPELLEVR